MQRRKQMGLLLQLQASYREAFGIFCESVTSQHREYPDSCDLNHSSFLSTDVELDPSFKSTQISCSPFDLETIARFVSHDLQLSRVRS